MSLESVAREFGLLLAVTVVVNLLGIVWYHPKVFGGAFTALTRRQKKPGTSFAKYISWAFSFLLVVLLRALLQTVTKPDSDTTTPYEVAAALCLFGLLANLPHHLYEEKPVKLYLIHWGYQVTYVASATILLMLFGVGVVAPYQKSSSSLF